MRFDRIPPRDGYRWWYLDAVSDDGAEALTVIVFLGSVFSPHYFRARARARARGDGDGPGVDPLAHAAFNVVLYRRRGGCWTFTERGRDAVEPSPNGLRIGPSRAAFADGALVLDVDEWGFPWPHRARGRIRVETEAIGTTEYALDPAGRHHWWPIAPCARVEVELERPSLRWRGRAYLDGNHGARPLERDFLDWDWSRHALASGATALFYDVRGRDGADVAHWLRVEADGSVEAIAPPPAVDCGRTRWWRVPRSVRSEGPAAVRRTLEDTPFYGRSLVETSIAGEGTVVGVHEHVDLGRFAQPWVQVLLPFRAPRRP